MSDNNLSELQYTALYCILIYKEIQMDPVIKLQKTNLNDKTFFEF